MLEEAKLLEEDYDNNVQKPWGTSFTVDGTSYATGLFWQPLQNQADPYTEVGEASEGVLEGADLFCIKPGKAPQFGICVSHEGYHSGELAAAVALSTSMSDRSSFIAVFKVGNGWWYTCVRNDIILSDGDILFLSEEEAKEQFMSMLAVPDWGRKIAPPEWELEETEYPDLMTILRKGAKAKLQKIKALRGTKLILVVTISAVVGFWLLSSIFSAIFFRPVKRPVIVPVQPKVIQKPVVAPEAVPWESVSNPQQVMKNCFAGVTKITKIMPPGWTLSTVSCTTKSISASWIREVGRISWINKALDKSGLIFLSRVVADDGNALLVTVPMGKITVMTSPPLRSEDQLKATLNDVFQAIGQEISLNNSAYTSERGKVYTMVGFKFESSQNPVIWSDLLTKFSGLEIKYINYKPDTKTWEYEGTIYAL